MPSAAQRLHQRDALLQFGRIEAGQPFVEQQQVGLQRQRAGQLQPLLVDVGERARQASRARASRPTRVEQRVGLGSAPWRPRRWRGRRPGRPARCRGRSATAAARTSWKVRATPSRAMRCAGMPAMAWPRSAMLPRSGRKAPDIRLSTVVLPEPFGPSRPTISPAPTREAEAIDGHQAAEAARQARRPRAAAAHAAPPRARRAVRPGRRCRAGWHRRSG